MKSLRWTSVVVGVLTYVAVAHAGVESSGGVDSGPFGTVWFRGAHPGQTIKACTEVSADFGVANEVADRALMAAFKAWGDYIVQKDVLDIEANGTPSIVSQLEMHASCDGREDLKVYFGAKDAIVRGALAHFDKPFGFAQTLQAPVHGWNRGFIYVATPAEIAPAPGWTTGNHLYGLLLHEVGHVFGNAHLDGTIMAADLSTYLSYGNLRLPELENIDQARELRSCQACAMTYPGTVETHPASDYAQRSFELVVGRAPVGLSAMRFEKKSKLNADGSHPADYNLPEGELVYVDASGEQRFRLKTYSMISHETVRVLVFGGMYSYGEVFLGELIDARGKALPVVVNVNMGGAAFDISLVVRQPRPQPLFTSTWIPYGPRE